jgi:hypothetical protein
MSVNTNILLRRFRLKFLRIVSRVTRNASTSKTPCRVHNKKWTKTTLKWDFSLATNEMKELTRKAFDQWQSISNLNFKYWHSQPRAVGKYNSIKPDILISFSNRYCNGPNRFDKLRILILKFATEMQVSCKFYCCFVHKSGTTLLK